MNIKPISQFLGEKISMVEPRIGFALQNLDKLYYLDKSIILRKIQFEKGMQLFNKYPFLGVGIEKFGKTEIINFNPDSEYFSIASPYGLQKNKQNRSAHNGHLGILTELGIFAFIFIELFFLIMFLSFIRNYGDLSNKFEGNILISFLGLFFYYFMISMHYSTQTWILFGLYSGAST
jgi:O-antigen ligase